MRKSVLFILPLIVFVIAGCSGGANVPTPPAVSTSTATASTAGAVSIVVALASPNPAVVGASVTASTTTGATEASTAVRSLADQTATRVRCGSTGCIISLAVPRAYDDVTITLTDANGNGITSGTLIVDGTGSQTSNVNVAFGGTPVRAVLAVDPSSFTQGTASQAQLSAAFYDSVGRQMIGGIPFPSPIPVSAGDSGAFTLSASAFANPNQTITINYNGSASTNPAFTTASVVATVSAAIETESLTTPNGDATGASPPNTKALAAAATPPPIYPVLPNIAQLPSGTASVDLTQYFPKSGGADGKGQSPTESCEAWSSAYNVRSYYMNRVNGMSLVIANTSPTAPPALDTTHSFSPSYVWNNLNYRTVTNNGTTTKVHANIGLSPIDVLAFETKKGMATLAALPFTTDFSVTPSSSLDAGAFPYHWSGAYNIPVPQLSDSAGWASSNSTVLTAIKNALLAGYPVWWSIGYDQSNQNVLDNLGTGTWSPTRWAGSKPRIGGHGMVIIGFDEVNQRFKFRNSWRRTWGDGSNNGYIAYNAIQNVTEYLGLPFINQVALYMSS